MRLKIRELWDEVLIDFQTSLEYIHKHEFEGPFHWGAACYFHREL